MTNTTPTEAVIARLTVHNEELQREVCRLREQLRDIESKADALRKAAYVEWRPL